MLSEGDRVSKSADAIKEHYVADLSKVSGILEWCWKLTKRRLQPGDILFEEGDIYCQVASKYVPLDMKQDLEVKR